MRWRIVRRARRSPIAANTAAGALQFRLMGVASWKVCALGALAPVLGAGFLGRFVAHLIARQRLRAWLDELEGTHELPRARLEELARTLRALK